MNPLVAIALGAVLLGETITPATGVGAALIVGSVFVAVRRESDPPAGEVAAPPAVADRAA